MVKLGLMHAVLLDWALEEEGKRKPRVADAFIQSLPSIPAAICCD